MWRRTDTFELYCYQFHYCLQIYFLNSIHSNGKPGYTCTCPTLWNYFETRNSKWVTEYLLSDKSDQKKTAKNDPYSQFTFYFNFTLELTSWATRALHVSNSFSFFFLSLSFSLFPCHFSLFLFLSLSLFLSIFLSSSLSISLSV